MYQDIFTIDGLDKETFNILSNFKCGISRVDGW